MNIQMIRTKSKEPKKKSFFCSHLNIEHITDADYAYAKRVCKDFEIKKLEEYHELYFQRDALLLAEVIEKLEICVLKYVNLILQNTFQLLD